MKIVCAAPQNLRTQRIAVTLAAPDNVMQVRMQSFMGAPPAYTKPSAYCRWLFMPPRGRVRSRRSKQLTIPGLWNTLTEQHEILAQIQQQTRERQARALRRERQRQRRARLGLGEPATLTQHWRRDVDIDSSDNSLLNTSVESSVIELDADADSQNTIPVPEAPDAIPVPQDDQSHFEEPLPLHSPTQDPPSPSPASQFSQHPTQACQPPQPEYYDPPYDFPYQSECHRSASNRISASGDLSRAIDTAEFGWYAHRTTASRSVGLSRSTSLCLQGVCAKVSASSSTSHRSIEAIDNDLSNEVL